MNIHLVVADGSDGCWVWFDNQGGQERVPPTRNPGTLAAYLGSNPTIRVKRMEELPSEAKLKLADCSYLSGWEQLVFSERAKQCLGQHIDALGQWVPLEFDEAPYWLFWLRHEVDALDEAASKLILFDDGKLMRIGSFAFKPEAVKNELFFTIKQQSGRYLFVTDAFMDLVREHQLTGFKFIPVWSSEGGSVFPNHNDPKVWRTGLEPRE